MQPSIVYDDIFALIKVLQPGHAVLQCEQYGGHLNRQQSLELIQLDDGTVTAITRLPGMTYYRGENKEFPTCLSNIHRIKELEKRTILQVKACDFELYLLQDKLIQENMKNNIHVDLMALAQHYGFPTPMLDITNDIIVAAFFATHRFDPFYNSFRVVTEGIGCIRQLTYLYQPNDSKFRIIGAQPYLRPHSQSGFGLLMEENEDFAKESLCIRFKQSSEKNMLFHNIIIGGEENFYPTERLPYIAEEIRKAPVVTSGGVERYCTQCGEERNRVLEILKRNSVAVVDAPLFHPEVMMSMMNSKI